METVRDLVRRTTDHEGLAIEPPARSRPYRYDDLAANGWKAGNLLSHYGAGPDRPVAVALRSTPSDAEAGPGRLLETAEPLFAILGALSIGAPVVLDPDSTVEAPVLVAPSSWRAAATTAAGTTELVFGDQPDSAAVAHFERERWSENPVEPPEALSAEAPALLGDESTGSLDHGDVLAGVADVLDGIDRDSGVAVTLRVAPSTPERLVAGVLAPLAAGVVIRPRAPEPGEAASESPQSGIELVDEAGDTVHPIDLPAMG